MTTITISGNPPGNLPGNTERHELDAMPRGIAKDAPVEQRQAFIREVAARAGMRLPDTRVPEGSSLIPAGETQLQRHRDDVDALPSVGEAHDALAKVEAIQQARDVTVPLGSVRMIAGSVPGFYGKDCATSNPCAATHRAFGHMLQLIGAPSGAGRVLAELPEDVRADAFNAFAERNADADRGLVMRTYRPSGARRVIRAGVSEKYAPLADSEILGAMLGVLPRDAKVRVTSEQDGTVVEALLPMMARQIKVGDILWARVRVENSQVKTRPVSVDASVFRVLCYNCTTAYSEDDDAVSMRHIGSADAMRRRLVFAIKNALDRVAPFVVAFGDAYSDALPDGLTRGEILTRMGKVFPSLGDDVMQLAATSWDMDGALSAGDTRGGVVNALTRASQELVMARAADVESVAGRLVTQGWSALQ